MQVLNLSVFVDSQQIIRSLSSPVRKTPEIHSVFFPLFRTSLKMLYHLKCFFWFYWLLHMWLLWLCYLKDWTLRKVDFTFASLSMRVFFTLTKKITTFEQALLETTERQNIKEIFRLPFNKKEICCISQKAAVIKVLANNVFVQNFIHIGTGGSIVS